jgi:hypothetical protein
MKHDKRHSNISCHIVGNNKRKKKLIRLFSKSKKGRLNILLFDHKIHLTEMNGIDVYVQSRIYL